VVVETGERQARYRLLATVRQYAREKLDQAGDADTTARRHRNFFLRRLDEASAANLDEWAALRWLGSDRENVRLALQWSLGAGDVDASLRLGSALRGYWTFNDQPGEGAAVLEQCLALAGDTQSTASVHVRTTLGFLYLQSGEIAGAEERFHQAMSEAESIGDVPGWGFA
jgi:predicted ATPase